MKLLLAVSGGIDSMYMAERALEGTLSADYGDGFAVAHCNFRLRGEESDGDERFVRQWCEAKGIRLHCRRFDTIDYSERNGVSMEMAARELRYGWFSELCKEFGYDAVAVAHNANDNAETLLLNMLRGCGAKGMCGMSSDSGSWPSRIVRPLLGTSREQILQWMLKEGKQWREDRTNSEDICKRNSLRLRVMPVFKEINPSYLRTFGANMRHLAQVNAIAEDYCSKAAQECISADGAIDLRKLRNFEHWEYLLFRFTQGHLNADGLLRLKKSVAEGRFVGGKIFGPYVVRKGKLRLI